MIDLFITNNKNLFCDVKTVPSVLADADHRLVLAEVKMKKPKEGAKCGRLRLKIEKLKDPECHVEFSTKVTETAQSVLENYVNNNIEGLWEEFKTKIYSISCETLGLKKMKTT